jgi:hypothetical protein
MYMPRRQQNYRGSQYADDGNFVAPPAGNLDGIAGALTTPLGGMNNARTFGRVGVGLGLLGAPMGLGAIGAGIGAAADAMNAEAQATSSFGTLGNEISGLSAFGDAISGGMFGSSAADQLSELGHEVSSMPDGEISSVEDVDSPVEDTFGYGPTVGYDDTMDESAGDGDKIICTELYRQGKLPRHIYENDAQVGREYAKSDPLVMKGYHVWGRPVARLMGRSRAVTAVVEPFAKAWAFHIAGQKSLLGAALFNIGVPICRIIGYALEGYTRFAGRNMAQGVEVVRASHKA